MYYRCSCVVIISCIPMFCALMLPASWRMFLLSDLLLLPPLSTESEAVEVTVTKALTEGGRFATTKVCTTSSCMWICLHVLNLSLSPPPASTSGGASVPHSWDGFGDKREAILSNGGRWSRWAGGERHQVRHSDNHCCHGFDSFSPLQTWAKPRPPWHGDHAPPADVNEKDWRKTRQTALLSLNDLLAYWPLIFVVVRWSVFVDHLCVCA